MDDALAAQPSPRRRSVRFPWGSVSLLEWSPATGSTGTGSRPTVVLLHGAGADSAELSWDSLSSSRHQDQGLGPELAGAGFRVLAPDHPGYGSSPLGTWPVDTDQYVDYLDELIAAEQLEDYALVGLSFGGALALGHALRSPRGLRSLVLISPHGITPGLGSGPSARPLRLATRAAVASGALGGLQRLTSRSERVSAASLAGVFHHPAQISPALRTAAARAAQDSDGFAAFSRWQKSEVTRDGFATDHTDSLTHLRTPTLLVHGAHDRGVPLSRAALAAERLPDGRLEVIADAGHWAQRERPDTVLPLIREFLTGRE